MKYLNLDPDFTPVSYGTANLIEFETFTFKGGEPHIKINPFYLHNYDTHFLITHRVNSFNDLGMIMVAVDAIRTANNEIKIDLILPYFPGARQDRVMIDGEPLTAKVYANIINSLKFNKVTILDPHSEVTPALLDNVKVIDNHKFVLKVLQDIYPQPYAKTPILISPDAGSNKKIGSLAKYLSNYNVMDVVKCDKTRNVKTGEITDFEVYSDDLGGRDCVIVDDICDGGGTFMGLGNKLREKNCGNLYLVVTHGIFSQGFKNLNNMFNTIYTTDSIKNYDDSYRDAYLYHKGITSHVKEVKIKNLL